MQPRKFHYLMNKAFAQYFEKETIDGFLPLRREMLRVWKKKSTDEFDGDSRSGEETYGYKQSSDILSDMCYISDRWNCAFRMKWLLDGIDNGKIAEACLV